MAVVVVSVAVGLVVVVVCVVDVVVVGEVVVVCIGDVVVVVVIVVGVVVVVVGFAWGRDIIVSSPCLTIISSSNTSSKVWV